MRWVYELCGLRVPVGAGHGAGWQIATIATLEKLAPVAHVSSRVLLNP